MKIYQNQYYHLFNRTNNEEALFRSDDNYLYFLKKYRFYLENFIDTIAYCLMPTHFHFLIRVKSENSSDDSNYSSDDFKSSDELKSYQISKQVAIWLRSYTRAYNNMWNRHGNLFNQKTKAYLVDSDAYLISLMTYIHQNPIRSCLVEKAEEWIYSSYQDYIDLRKGTLPDKKLILNMIRKQELKELTDRKLLTKGRIQ